MDFSEIRPFVRYARYVSVTDAVLPDSSVIPCDTRFFYGADGEGVIETEAGIYRMKKGSVLILNSGVRYRYVVSSPDLQASYIVLNFDYTQEASQQKIPVPPKSPEDFSKGDILAQAHFESVPELSGVVFLEEMHRLSGRLAEIVREYARNVIFNETKMSGILADVLVDCVRKLRLNASPAGGGRVDAILDYIHVHYRESVTNGQLGKKFNFHPNYVSAMIKKYTGMPLHKYLNHVRIAHALEILNDEAPTVGELANECGFCDIYYFSRCFKNAVGVSPTEYRKRRRR